MIFYHIVFSRYLLLPAISFLGKLLVLSTVVVTEFVAGIAACLVLVDIIAFYKYRSRSNLLLQGMRKLHVNSYSIVWTQRSAIGCRVRFVCHTECNNLDSVAIVYNTFSIARSRLLAIDRNEIDAILT